MPIVTPSTSFTFLNAVNRLLLANGIIRGDTDAISTFSDLQHSATVALAQVAIQDELNELIADTVLPSERDSTGSITTSDTVASYALPTDFVRFFGVASLYYVVGNFRVYEYPGGEQSLQGTFPDYRTNKSNPIHFYFDLTTTKKVGFWPVPQDAKTYTFDYEADVQVSNASDTLPFHNNSESFAFCRLASRRFKMLYEGMDPALVANDPEHINAKATLFNLIIGKNPPTRYAPVYR